jgi:ABC-2 type transport system ATP-binding protein
MMESVGIAAKEDGTCMAQPVVLTKHLRKYFPSEKGAIKAVDGVNLSVQEGEVFAFLGPNGAGKTTTLRMLATLMTPTQGSATIAGFDIVEEPGEVRRRIGYVGQNGGSDRPATGLENLILQGRLYGMSYQEARARANELIRLLQLDDFAERIVYTYSGGQRRRLDVAIGIMHRPEVLFLDEPTVGLDPQNRANLWEQIKKLKQEGVTIFLTTHYLEEADILADRVTIIDHGKIVAEGTPEALKRAVGGDRIIVSIENQKANGQRIAAILRKQSFTQDITQDSEYITIHVGNGATAISKVIQLLREHDIKLITLTVTEPSLDDVFLQKTGYSLRDTDKDGK